MRITLIFIVAGLTSCNLFLKKLTGIRDPKMENYHSITEYAKTLTIDSTTLVFAKDSISFVKLNKIFEGTPEILIFNSEKTFLPYKNDSIACNAPIDLFLKNICNIEMTHVNSQKKINYADFVQLLDDPNHVLNSLNDKAIDFIVFGDFVKFSPKANKMHIINWQKEFKEHSGNCNPKLVYVDLDYLETWGISKKSLPKLKLNKR